LGSSKFCAPDCGPAATRPQHVPSFQLIVPQFFDYPAADWYIEKVEDGFLIRNVKYQEYLYAAADDRAFDENNRSVFTWKDFDTLGPEGIWIFDS